jgi:hypothetical protein
MAVSFFYIMKKITNIYFDLEVMIKLDSFLTCQMAVWERLCNQIARDKINKKTFV